MGALFDVNFVSTLPATEATVLNVGDGAEKKQNNVRKLNNLRIGADAF